MLLIANITKIRLKSLSVEVKTQEPYMAVNGMASINNGHYVDIFPDVHHRGLNISKYEGENILNRM